MYVSYLIAPLLYLPCKGSLGQEESCNSEDDSDSDSKGPVLSDNEEEAVESVIASLATSNLGRSTAQTQGHSLHKWSRAEFIIPMITIPLNTGIDKIIAAHPDLVQGAETTEQLCTKNISTPRN